MYRDLASVIYTHTQIGTRNSNRILYVEFEGAANIYNLFQLGTLKAKDTQIIISNLS